ncbi:MAG: hypothetical protein K6F59_04090 [Gammaproteobacteria bacterium]|nr:hypothetical protein [Gammaproteobacteria bacterium]
MFQLKLNFVKILQLAYRIIPAIVGPFMGSFAAASVFKAFFNKKAEPPKEVQE